MLVELVRELEIDDDTGETHMITGDVTYDSGKFCDDDEEIKKNLKPLEISLFNQALEARSDYEGSSIVNTFVSFGRMYCLVTVGGNG